MQSKRGFAAMDPERRRQIAASGGKTAHAKGNAHEFTTETARAAGKLGGRGRRARREAAALHEPSSQ
jgi:general stress protein YciG